MDYHLIMITMLSITSYATIIDILFEFVLIISLKYFVET